MWIYLYVSLGFESLSCPLLLLLYYYYSLTTPPRYLTYKTDISQLRAVYARVRYVTFMLIPSQSSLDEDTDARAHTCTYEREYRRGE